MFCGSLERVGYEQRPPPSGNAPLYRVEVMNGNVGCKSLRVHSPFISHDFFEYLVPVCFEVHDEFHRAPSGCVLRSYASVSFCEGGLDHRAISSSVYSITSPVASENHCKTLETTVETSARQP